MEENRNEEVLEETAQETDTAAQETEETAADTDAETVNAEEPSADKAEEAAESEDPAEQNDPKRKSLFGKKKKDKKDTQIEELTDRVQRQMAEFDNFRKRSEKEKAAMYEIGAKSVIEKILPTIDNFERGFAAVTEEQKSDPFVEGMEKVYRQMLTTLEGIGVKPIEAVGKPFDPKFHNAVMHVEDEEAGENTVVEEFQKGYLYRDSVVRHSMVKVAN
ncbi:MAG: nucleotide exchange factor GrpE [Candidatus Choladocola sp.]|nr:nucleotide exchange factor GrpE [Candidatus Choladocola sp.]